MIGPTVQTLLAEAVRALSGIENARLEAEVLLQNALDAERAWLYAHAGERVAPGPASDFQRLVANRRLGCPVAYLIGQREFWSIDLAVDRSTLIPRPETELLVETGLKLGAGRQRPRVLDLGTGCGAIAIAMGKERPDAQVLGTDLSAEALAMARRNAACQGLPNLEFRHSDWYAALHGERFDLILCNPPYVDSADPALAGDGLRFEPRLALDGGPGGLRALGAVIAGAGRHLVPGGWLVVEHGGAQRSAVTSMLKLAGFTGITTLTDMAGAERASLGVWQ